MLAKLDEERSSLLRDRKSKSQINLLLLFSNGKEAILRFHRGGLLKDSNATMISSLSNLLDSFSTHAVAIRLTFLFFMTPLIVCLL